MRDTSPQTTRRTHLRHPGDFLNELNAQTGKKINSAQAASLNSQAQNIEAALDC